MALAASGLFLPDWLEEVDAREGALGGAKGGRRGRDRRGRHKQRSHGDKKDKHNDQDKPRGLVDDWYGVEFGVELTRGRPVKVDFYHKPRCDNCGRGSRRWEFFDRNTLAMPGHGLPTHTFSTAKDVAALWIDDRYLVRASNQALETPFVQMGSGGEFVNLSNDGWRNGRDAGTLHLTEGESAPPMHVEGYSIQVMRLDDANKDKLFANRRKRYKVTIAAPAA